jgi:hypothetical protein
MLAAALAAAATIGAFVGSLSVGGVAQFWPQIAPSSSNVAASGGAQAAKTELAELSALKTDLEGVARNLNNQFAKLAERLDRMERAEADLHAKPAHIGEAVDRLEMARESVKASDAAPAGVAITGTIPNSSSASAEPEPCRIGSCTPCAGAMRWSKIATATFSRSPAAGRSLGRRDRAGLISRRADQLAADRITIDAKRAACSPGFCTFSRDDFTHHHVGDVYSCPAGKMLTTTGSL